jgi:threonine aldolase
VSFCLSKGLGAPVGSVLVGSREHIEKARVFRKALGGGMRQAGVLAAAGILALEEGPGLLAADHAHARMIAEAVAGCEGVEIDLDSVQTNIVIFTLTDEGDAPGLVARLKDAGVLSSAIGPHQVRLVTHSQVSSAQCEQVAEVLVKLLATVAA